MSKTETVLREGETLQEMLIWTGMGIRIYVIHQILTPVFQFTLPAYNGAVA